MEGRIKLWAGLRLLVVSWLSNLIGCLLMLGLFHGARVWPNRWVRVASWLQTVGENVRAACSACRRAPHNLCASLPLFSSSSSPPQ